MGTALLKLLFEAQCLELRNLASIGHKADAADAAGVINTFQAVS